MSFAWHCSTITPFMRDIGCFNVIWLIPLNLHVHCCIVSHARTAQCSVCGMSSLNFKKLLRVQNTLARVVLKRRIFDHITPSLVERHWLPKRQRTTFTLATLTYKLFHSSQPHSLSNALHYIGLSATCDLLIKCCYLLLECEQPQHHVVLNILQFPFGRV